MTPSARNRWTLLVGGGLFLVLVSAWIVWFLQNFERAERTVRSDMSTEARRNPYLAAERYLDRLGYTAETVRGREYLKAPPPYPGALVVSDPGPRLPPAEEGRLLDWVEAGGHMMLTPRRVWDDDTGTTGNGLLDRLGVRLHRRPIELDESDGSGEPAETATASDDTETIAVGTASDGAPNLVAFDKTLYLEDAAGTADWSVNGEHGAHALAWERGRGRITVLSGDRFMRNEQIGELDHAWFVSDLLKGHDQVWLLIDASVPPLGEWLWRHAPQAVVSFCLLVVVWLWYASRTHGPRRRPRHRVRRNILEHLGAAAAFSWQRDRGRDLLDGSRAAIETAWTRRHPKLEQMDRRARCEWIAQYTGLPVEEVAAALYEPPADEQGLIHVTDIQQRLIQHCRSGS